MDFQEREMTSVFYQIISCSKQQDTNSVKCQCRKQCCTIATFCIYMTGRFLCWKCLSELLSLFVPVRWHIWQRDKHINEVSMGKFCTEVWCVDGRAAHITPYYTMETGLSCSSLVLKGNSIIKLYFSFHTRIPWGKTEGCLKEFCLLSIRLAMTENH